MGADAFWSPAGGIDPAPSIPVMHRASSGAEPSTNVPSGKGMGCGSWQEREGDGAGSQDCVYAAVQ